MSETHEEFEQEELEQEESLQEEQTQQEPQYLTKDDLDAFKQEMLGVLRSQGSTKAEATKETNKLTAEQIQAFAQNPELMIQYIESKTQETQTTVSRKIEQERWDRKAYEDFPLLKKKGSDFEKLVIKEIEHLSHYGDMDRNSPRLLYVAARNANAQYSGKSQGSQAAKPNDTALSPSAKKSVKPQSKEDKEFFQKTQMLRANGYSEEKIKQMYERYTGAASVRKSEESGRIRRKVRLG